MQQAQHTLRVATQGPGLYEVTDGVTDWTARQGIATGLLTLFSRHTSASLVIQENADPQVMDDLQRFFRRLVPDGDPLFRHVAEGPDDMPAHVKSALTATSLNVPVGRGRPLLGTWQGIFLFEHRAQPHDREVTLHLVGE
jgi:secondary thiamine-phosphate synthase enzyme